MAQDDDATLKGNDRDDADSRGEHMYDDVAKPPSTRPITSTAPLRPPGQYAAGADGGVSITTPEGKDAGQSRRDQRRKRLSRRK